MPRPAARNGAAGPHTFTATEAPLAIDYKSPLGQVRLLSADFDEAAPLLTDDQLSAYLAMNNDNVLRAAADALETAATSESLISKKIRTQDLSTDGPAVATDLRKQAASLRARADAADATDPEIIEVDSGFEVIPMFPARRGELEEWRW